MAASRRKAKLAEVLSRNTLTERLEVELKAGDIVLRAEHGHLPISEIIPNGSVYLSPGTLVGIAESGELCLSEQSRVEVTASLVFPDRQIRFNRFPAELRKGAVLVAVNKNKTKTKKAA